MSTTVTTYAKSGVKTVVEVSGNGMTSASDSTHNNTHSHSYNNHHSSGGGVSFGSATAGKENASSSSATLASAKKDKPVRQRTALYSEYLPTFYVGAGNNSEL